MNRLFLLLLYFCSIKGFAQKQTDTLRLYYAINETESPTNFNRLDSSINALGKKTLDVGIYGYADFLSNDSYNLGLSFRRAEAVKNYLNKKMLASQINIYACEGLGEKFSKNNGSSEGNILHRRVDVYFESVVIYNVSNDKLETPKKTDTVIAIAPGNNITELKTGESLALNGLSFEPGRHFILKESASVLLKLLQALKENDKLKIEIQGHVCCTINGADGMDLDTREMNLSKNRAKAVYDYLISKGIDKTRLTYKGLARTRPKIQIENTPEEEQANRRVEIMVIEK